MGCTYQDLRAMPAGVSGSAADRESTACATTARSAALIRAARKYCRHAYRGLQHTACIAQPCTTPAHLARRSAHYRAQPVRHRGCTRTLPALLGAADGAATSWQWHRDIDVRSCCLISTKHRGERKRRGRERHQQERSSHGNASASVISARNNAHGAAYDGALRRKAWLATEI